MYYVSSTSEQVLSPRKGGHLVGGGFVFPSKFQKWITRGRHRWDSSRGEALVHSFPPSPRLHVGYGVGDFAHQSQKRQAAKVGESAEPVVLALRAPHFSRAGTRKLASRILPRTSEIHKKENGFI